MSVSRRCGVTCTCWCDGLFHGPNAEPAREAFRQTFGDGVPPLPPGEAAQRELFDDAGARFARGLAAARETRT